MEWNEKIFAILITEMAYALLFVLIIILVSSLPNSLVNEKIYSWSVDTWVLAGAITPFVIIFEIWNHIRIKEFKII